MDFRCLLMFITLSLILMTAHGALPPERYWERMLPNTPIPKAIIELLNLGVKDSKETHSPDEDENPLFFYGVKDSKEVSSQDRNPLFYYGVKDSKEANWQNENPLFFYGIKDSKEGLSNDENLFYIYGVKDFKEVSSHDINPLFFYGVKDSKETLSKDGNPLFFYGEKGSKETHSQDENPLFFYGIKDSRESLLKDGNPLFFYGVKDSKEVSSQDRNSLFFYGVKDSKEVLSKDENPLFFYGVKGLEAHSHGKNLLSFYGVKDSKEALLKDGNPLFFYGIKDSKETSSQDENPLFFYGVKNFKEALSKDENLLFFYGVKDSANTHSHVLHGKPNEDIVFFEEGLRPGTKLDAHFEKKNYTAPLFPRHVSKRIPFSSGKKKEILKMLFKQPKFEDVKMVENAFSLCETPGVTGEEKHCATSLESVVDFVISKLGKNVNVISTEVESETMSKKFLVKDGVKKLADENVITCHPLDYPYVVYFCHHLSQNTTAHLVPLEGEDGTRVKAVALCHKDTSEWNPNKAAFKVLNVKPGTVPVCHIIPKGHLLWFSK
ncbi:BURP domain-containing protein 9-like [Abrus precatorius]|uniref:BURP domain-containing protein 9-like n=1 Tax=Abrus precatorius TaxID=3816 RepID=A0A8B8K1R0_ABRPR|nr:BURP domain-containing protein 9-like [Abrus precatorius]